MRIWSPLLFAAVMVFATAGCNDDAATSDVHLDHTDLSCPDDSLMITTDIDGGFQPGAVVTFTNGDGSVMYDGSAVVLADGSIDCGFPPGAIAGEYEVRVNGMGVGVVTLDSSTCSS